MMFLAITIAYHLNYKYYESIKWTQVYTQTSNVQEVYEDAEIKEKGSTFSRSLCKIKLRGKVVYVDDDCHSFIRRINDPS